MFPAPECLREQLFRKDRALGELETRSFWCPEPRLRAVGAMKLSPRLAALGLLAGNCSEAPGVSWILTVPPEARVAQVSVV